MNKNIKEHEIKLEEYKQNPDKFDNKGFLKNAPTNEIREKIIQGRIKHLEDEIKNFEEQINQLRDQ